MKKKSVLQKARSMIKKTENPHTPSTILKKLKSKKKEK